MDEFVRFVAEQAPDIGALVLIVYLFLKSLDRRDERIDRFAEKHVQAMQRNTEALTEVKVYLERLNGRAKP